MITFVVSKNVKVFKIINFLSMLGGVAIQIRGTWFNPQGRS